MVPENGFWVQVSAPEELSTQVRFLDDTVPLAKVVIWLYGGSPTLKTKLA